MTSKRIKLWEKIKKDDLELGDLFLNKTQSSIHMDKVNKLECVTYKPLVVK